MKYQKILDLFFDEYLRPPTQSEFEDITGKFALIKLKYGNYRTFLEEHGYRTAKRNISYVVSDLDNNPVFIGTIDEVAEEFEITEHTVRNYSNSSRLLNDKYYVKRKPFLINDFLRILERES